MSAPTFPATKKFVTKGGEYFCCEGHCDVLVMMISMLNLLHQVEIYEVETGKECSNCRSNFERSAA